MTENVEIDGLFSQRKSDMVLGGTGIRELGSWNVDTYHGYFAYNFGDSDARVRPYLMVGLGPQDTAK